MSAVAPPSSSTTSVRVLTTYAIDAAPSLLLTVNSTKILINCPEGCQRSLLEQATKVGASKISAVCLTHVGHDAVGGLPGFVLTASDVMHMAEAEGAAQLAKQINTKNDDNTARIQSDKNSEENENTKAPSNATSFQKRSNQSQQNGESPSFQSSQPHLEMFGPPGTKLLLHSLRHFMRRDNYEMHITEGDYMAQPAPAENSKQSKKSKKKKKSRNESEESSFRIQSLSFPLHQHQDDTPASSADTENVESQKRQKMNGDQGDRFGRSSQQICIPNRPIPTMTQSFIFTTPPILGRFRVEDAKNLGIPRGPIYGQLKRGMTVEYVHIATGETCTVDGKTLVEPGCPEGVAVVVIYYPNQHVLEQLMECNALEKSQFSNGDFQGKPILDVVYHLTTTEIFNSPKCCKWREAFASRADHIFVESRRFVNDEVPTHPCNSPFASALQGAYARSCVDSQVYPAPVGEGDQDQPNGKTTVNPSTARSLSEYVLVPRSKKGMVLPTAARDRWDAMTNSAQQLSETASAVHAVRELNLGEPAAPTGAELLFTGTGSAVPCKHRNVSGIYLQMGDPDNHAVLLDVGEGTTGQLLRAKLTSAPSLQPKDVLRRIKAVWISHPHADHHLGLLRLLSERNHIAPSDPLVLIAPPNLKLFLDEYSMVDVSIRGSFQYLNCYSVKSPPPSGLSRADEENRRTLLERLSRDLGITSIRAVPVMHCRDAFAIILQSGSSSFGCVAYSGDCRPSQAFGKVGKSMGVDLLIHEATFEDGMEAEAVVKRHSTVGEALDVASQMESKMVVLTHFSQRYPKVSPPSTSSSVDPSSIIYAFDFLRLTPGTLRRAAALTPAIRQLYSDANPEQQELDATDDANVAAAAALSVPGLFAQPGMM